MLASIRERAGRFVVGGILLLLIVPFALWGIGSYFEPTPNAAVARVGDLDIGPVELQRATRDATERYQELLGERFRPGMLDATLVRRQALDELVRQKLLELDALQRGLTIDDATLRTTIAANPAFAGEQGFDPERYRALLREQGYTPVSFEGRVRGAMLVEQLRRGIADTAWVSDVELERMARLWFETRNVEVAVLLHSTFMPTTPPTDAKIKDYYTAHAQQFRTQEQARVAYVLLDRAELIKTTRVEPAAVAADYQQHARQYTTPERRALSHILIAMPKDASAEQVRSAQARLLEIKQRLDAGADFAALARDFSEDSGTAGVGGQLGSFTRGTLEAPLDDAAFALAADAVSEPVRSSFGWHLLRVERITPAQVQPLEAVAPQIEQQLRERQADELLLQRAEELRRIAFEQPDTLAPAAEAVGAQIQQTGLFGRSGGEGVAANPAFVTAAFSDGVLTQGVNSEVIELDAGRYAVLRVLEHLPASPLSVEQARATIAERLMRASASKAAARSGAKILAELSGGTARDAVTAPSPLSWRALPTLTRDSAVALDPAVLGAAFKTARPKAGKTTYGGVALANGDYVLIAVTGIGTDARATDPAQREALKQALLRARSDAAMAGYVQALRGRIPVKVYTQHTD